MEIVCTGCNVSYHLSEDRIPIETTTGTCKKCGAKIVVRGKNDASSIIKEMTDANQPILEDEKKTIPSEETKQCPYCAETIKKNAKICRFCHIDLLTDQPIQTQQSNASFKIPKFGLSDTISRLFTQKIRYTIFLLIVLLGLYFLRKAWINHIILNIVNNISSEETLQKAEDLGLGTNPLNRYKFDRIFYATLGVLLITFPLTFQYIHRLYQFVVMKFKSKYSGQQIVEILTSKLLITIYVLGLTIVFFSWNSTNPYIDRNCVMNGFGQGKCSFTNTNGVSGSICGYIKVNRGDSDTVVLSEKFCSGKVEPSSTTTVEFAIPDVRDLCPGGLTESSCNFIFVDSK